MLGMLPYSFTVTSHIIVTLLMAIFIFIAVTDHRFLKHGFGYLKLFVPSGVPAHFTTSHYSDRNNFLFK